MREFDNLESFIRFATRLIPAVEAAGEIGVERGAALIRKEAKAELGHYQPEAGPFPEWPELADSTKDERESQGFARNAPLLRDGTLRDNIEQSQDGTHARVGVPSKMVSHSYGDYGEVDIGDIAIWLSLGTEDGRIQPRDFLGHAGVTKGEQAAETAAAAVVNALAGRPARNADGPLMDVGE